ncbi:hypothetical protein [Spirosoma gilvum]
MKTSDKLLIASALISLVALVGSTVALRREHDKIDFNDPFYGYEAVPIKPFKVLRVEGSLSGIKPHKNAPGLDGSTENPTYSSTNLGVQAGKAFEIRTQKNNKIRFTYRSVGDTLFIQYEPEFSPWRISAEKTFAASSFAYVIVPSLVGLIATSSTCRLTGITTENVSIQATNAHVLLANSTINQLTSNGQQGSLVQTTATNHIHSALITSRDSTSFIAERNVFDSITMQNDSMAILKIPASLLKKL